MSDQINYLGGQKMSHEKLQQMKQAVNTVFKNSNPYEGMFQDWVKQKMLLSLPRYTLDKKQFLALLKVLKILEETSFYVSRVEGCDLSEIYDVESPACPHWEFSSNVSHEEYKIKMIPMDYVLYSTNGTWGIFIDHEDYAVVGGTNEFMTLFKQFYSYVDYNLKKFMQQDFDVRIANKLVKYVNAPIEQYNHRVELADEQLQQIKQAFMNVFKDTYISYISDGIFSSAIKEKMLLCCTDAFYLNKQQFLVLLKIIKNLGESSFYVSRIDERGILNMFGSDDKQDDHFELSSDVSYEEYQKKTFFLEYALYSKNGTWGVLISQEEVALIGGSQDFIAIFKKLYEQWDEDIKKLIAGCKHNKEHYGSDISWLEDVLKYIDFPADL